MLGRDPSPRGAIARLAMPVLLVLLAALAWSAPAAASPLTLAGAVSSAGQAAVHGVTTPTTLANATRVVADTASTLPEKTVGVVAQVASTAAQPVKDLAAAAVPKTVSAVTQTAQTVAASNPVVGDAVTTVASAANPPSHGVPVSGVSSPASSPTPAGPAPSSPSSPSAPPSASSPAKGPIVSESTPYRNAPSETIPTAGSRTYPIAAPAPTTVSAPSRTSGQTGPSPSIHAAASSTPASLAPMAPLAMTFPAAIEGSSALLRRIADMTDARRGGHGGGSASPEAPSPVAPAPGGGLSSAAGSSSGFAFSVFLTLAGLLAMGVPWTRRRVRLVSQSCGPEPFLLMPERPG